jgi:hypothetical protein
MLNAGGPKRPQDKKEVSRSRDVRADFSQGTPYHLLEEIERLQDLYGKLEPIASWSTSVDAFQLLTVTIISWTSLLSAVAVSA